MHEENLVKTQGDNYNHAFTEIISSHCVLLTTAQGDQILTLPINSSTTRLLLWVQLLCDWHRKFQFWYFQQQRIGIWFFDGYLGALSFCGYFCFYEIWVTDVNERMESFLIKTNYCKADNPYWTKLDFKCSPATTLIEIHILEDSY